jgi:hypothetical protein
VRESHGRSEGVPAGERQAAVAVAEAESSPSA